MGKLHPLRGNRLPDNDDDNVKRNYSTTTQISNKHKVNETFKLKNYDKELYDAEVAIEELKFKVDTAIVHKTLNDNVHGILYEEIIRVLDYTGRLSMQVFKINEELETLYLQKYKKTPALAKELWLQHYDQLHQPYSKIKNRCFKLLDKLDQGYINIFNRFPPNWNP